MDNSFKAAVESRIEAWINTEKKNAPTEEAKLLLDRMLSLVMRGGKRARPLLLYLTYDAYGGNDRDKLVDLGAALELHHQFLLVHDDIIDNDDVRYGGPNIVGYYNQDRLSREHNISQAMGILAGDLLFSFSNQIIVEAAQLSDTQKMELLQLLARTNAHVAYGQQLDAYNVYTGSDSLDFFTEAKQRAIHVLKTASYTSRLPMQCAAILLDLSQSERKKIDNFALPFGILFQLVDDYSDYFDNSSAFNNRPKYRDFRQGKMTYPLHAALALATDAEIAFLMQNFGKKELSAVSIQEVVAILEKCGARDESSHRLEKYFTQARNALDRLLITVSSKKEFVSIIDRYRV